MRRNEMELVFKNILNTEELENILRELEKGKKSFITNGVVKFNFANTRWFSASSLILLIIVFYGLKKENKDLDIKITLPTKKNSEKDNSSAHKSRDFLKRWKFFDALRFCFGKDTIFFEQDQKEYLVEEQIYYLPTRDFDEFGILKNLYSSQVIEISPFIEKKENEFYISQNKINRYLANFSEERILSRLDKVIDWGTKKYFNSNNIINFCIKEPLSNAFDHASANIGLATAQLDNKYFIISIIDNGVGIPATVRRVYKQLEEASDEKTIQFAFDPPDKKEIEKALKNLKQDSNEYDAELIKIAHFKGVTSKPKTHGGLGLYQLKEFVFGINGFFEVRSSKAIVRFDGRKNKKSITTKKCTNQLGTLISIYLPYKNDDL
jgi:hypothetical protein